MDEEEFGTGSAFQHPIDSWLPGQQYGKGEANKHEMRMSVRT